MVSSNILLALLAGTASACKYKLYAAQFDGNLTTLEFTLNDADQTGTLKAVASTGACGKQPTWQVLSALGEGEGQTTVVECIDESWTAANGSIVGLAEQATGAFTVIKNETIGNSPVHIEPLSLDSGEYRYVALFHHEAPGISVLKKNTDGSHKLIQTFDFPGKKVEEGQPTPPPGISKIHQTVVHPSGEYLIAEDFGVGAHKIFSIDQATGQLKYLKDEKTVVGIRHAVFTSPDNQFCNDTTFFHAVNELQNTIESYKVSDLGDGKGLVFESLGKVSTFPDNKGTIAARASEIVESDGFIIASNRKNKYIPFANPDPANKTEILSDSLVSYKIGPKGNLIVESGANFPSGGDFPRHFSLPADDGSLIAVGNGESKSVTIFARDIATGKIGKALATTLLPGGVSHIAWGEKE